MELLVVVVILGVMAGFAIPNYTRSIRQAHERDMVDQLRVIHAANLMYRAQADTYLAAAALDTQEINNQLGLSLMSSDATTYSYEGDGTVFRADATWSDMNIQLDQTPLSENNPCCASSNCPTLQGC